MRALPIIALIPTTAPPPPAPEVLRHRAPGSDLPLAAAVEIPPGVTLVQLAAEVPGGPGDTRSQTRVALHAIAERLTRLGLRFGDLVRLQVSLAGDPVQQGRADREGFAAAWREACATGMREDPPLVSIVHVAGLGEPGSLVGIEATAVRPREAPARAGA